MKPEVSIIIPSYNRAHCIGETLQSVQHQSYDAWECLVVDDGSTDGTLELVAAFAKADSRIQLYQRPDEKVKGANSCRNYGLSKSNGNYIQWLDSDDLLSDNKLASQLERLSLEKNNIATCLWGYYKESRTNTLQEHLEVYRDFKTSKQFLNALTQKFGFLPIHAYLIPRKLLDKHKVVWDESLRINQDGDFMSQVFLQNPSIVFAPDAHVWYRLDNTPTVSSIDQKEKAIAAINSWKGIENRLGVFSPEYIRFMKKKLYDRLATKFPKLVEEEHTFFKNRSTNSVSWIRKIKSILR